MYMLLVLRHYKFKSYHQFLVYIFFKNRSSGGGGGVDASPTFPMVYPSLNIEYTHIGFVDGEQSVLCAEPARVTQGGTGATEGGSLADSEGTKEYLQ